MPCSTSQNVAAHVTLVAQGQQHAAADARVEGLADDQLCRRAPRLVGRPVSVCAGFAGSARDTRGL